MTNFVRLTAPIGLLLAALLAMPAAAEVSITVDNALEPARITARAGTKQIAAGANTLVLPFYGLAKLDSNGETTLYAVRNNSANPVTVRFSYYGVGGGAPAKVEERVIGAHAVRTVNLREVTGLPGDGKGQANGFLTAEALGDGLPAGVISGDYFRLVPSDAAANGGTMMSSETTDCRRWSHRFLSGGPFGGETRLAVLALDRPVEGPTIAGNVYDEKGNLVSVITVTSDVDAFEISDTDLNLPVSFGSIDWVFQGAAHGAVGTTFTASGLFSVGTEAACVDGVEVVDDPGPGPAPGTVTFELPGNFFTCRRCANWQYDMPFGGRREFSKVVVDFEVFVAGWDPANFNGFHCIFWLNNGNRWQEMMGYLNSRGTQNRTVFQSNGSLGSPIGVETYASPGVLVGESYRVHYEYDTVDKVVWYEIRTMNGDLRVSDLINLPSHVGPLSTNFTFIQFGSQPGGSAESLTENWRWSNFRAQFIP